MSKVLIAELREEAELWDSAGKIWLMLTSAANALDAAYKTPRLWPVPFVQQMIEDCLPGGHSCDPQQVADAIRAWAKARGLE